MTDPLEPRFNPYTAPRAEIVVPERADAAGARLTSRRLIHRFLAAIGDVGIGLVAVNAAFFLTFLAARYTQSWTGAVVGRVVKSIYRNHNLYVSALGFVMFSLYAIAESSSRQATICKQLAGFRLVGRDGGRIGFLRAFFRTAIKWLLWPLGIVSVLLMAADPQRRAVHDWACGTRVIEVRGHPD